MDGINTWWKDSPLERFWFGIADHDGKAGLLAAPRGARHHTPSWMHSLIKHVRAGDVVFHYDEAKRAIVEWSTARGRVHQRRLAWSRRAEGPDPGDAATRVLPSWAIALEGPEPLESAVSLEQIAAVQWELFPALHAFEEKVGDPLYYPFEIVSPSETRLLPGYVFKLPGLIVERFPALAQVAISMRWSSDARTRATDHAATNGEAPACRAAARRPADRPGWPAGPKAAFSAASRSRLDDAT